jgi:thiol-disulfide isomerase/thioredoxin
MNNETNRSWTSLVMVIVLCAAIGFGAVYAIVGGGDNSAEPAGEQKAKAPVTGLKNEAPAKAVKVSSTTVGRQVLNGSNGRPLNRGEMTTFVFKKQPMPVANPPTFNGPDGKAMKLSDLKGKVVLLNLWATWCAPCRKEMPFLDKLQAELGSDQFEVVALSVDRGDPDKARKFLEEVGATSLKFYHDPTAQAGFSLMAIGMPTTLLFDREGREIGRLVGPAEWHSDDAKALIKAAIAAG